MQDSRKAGSEGSSLWIALFFASSSWLFLLPAFAVPVRWVGLALTACAAAACVFAYRRERSFAFNRRYAIFLVPLIVSAALIPFPYNLGPALTALGIAAGCLSGRFAFAGMGLAFTGIVMTVQSAVLPFYSAYASRHHGAGIAAPAAGFILRMLGLRTAWSGGSVFVGGSMTTYAFSITWEKLALLSILLVLAGGTVILLLTGSRKRKIAWLFLAVLLYALLREVLMTLTFMDGGGLRVFLAPAVTCLSLLPLCLVLLKLLPTARLPRPRYFAMDRRFWLAGASAFLCVVFLTAAWGYRDPGIRKQGRVLIDEKHSNWEWTTQAFDTNWYGEKSTYNYYSFYTYLDSFYQMQRNFETLTDETLAGFDVLIVKVPTESFTSNEVDAIARFVDNGGGLFLIGDHTNVFGTSTYLNPVASRFGLRFRFDATYDLDSGGLSEYGPPGMMPHPIVQAMPTFLFATSCTLEAPLGAAGVIDGYRLRSNFADYSQKNFFPAETATPATEFGSFLQAAAVDYGRGRVFAFTDSTIFSNFWMFIPGKPELALGAVEWLDRKGGAFDLNTAFLAAGAVFLLLALLFAIRGRGFKSLLAVLSCGLLAFALVPGVLGAMERSAYTVPQPRREITTIAFDEEHCDYSLPATLQGFRAGADRRYLTFYVWGQRLDCVPYLSPSLKEATQKGEVVVLINPVKSLTNLERRIILDYVSGGGKLLLMDSAANTNSTANQILELFGINMDREAMGPQQAVYDGDKVVWITEEACSIRGGQTLLSTTGGKSILSITPFGDGLVAAFGDSALFSDSSMGEVDAVPDETQMQVSELEFWTLRTLLGRQNGGEPTGREDGN